MTTSSSGPTAEKRSAVTAFVPSDIVDLLDAFLSNRQKDLVHLRSAVAAADYVALQRIGERMRGVGNPYGFDEITRFGDRIREVCARADEDPVKRRIAVELAISEYEDYLRKVQIVKVHARVDTSQWTTRSAALETGAVRHLKSSKRPPWV